MKGVKEIKSRFLKAEEVASIMEISKPTAYKIIQKLNKELEEQGKIIVQGKISRRYFEEKIYA